MCSLSETTRVFWTTILIVYVLHLQTFAASVEIECIPLKLCPMALKLIATKKDHPDTVAFLRYSHCGFEGKEPKIWCNKFDMCKTPDERTGTCKNIEDCSSFLNLLSHVDLSTAVAKKYLTEFRCNSEHDTEVKVCCTEEKEYGVTHTPEVRNRFFDPLPNPHLQECGVQNSDNRIYGGSVTNLDEFPWMALIKYKQMKGGYVYGCGGSLINSRYILTAAHCLDKNILRRKDISKLHSIVLGEYDTRNKTDCIYEKYGTDCADPAKEYRIQKSIVHPKYISGHYHNDIALVRLIEDVEYSDYIKPICLPQSILNLKRTDIYTISGWGKTNSDKVSHIKRKARVELVSRDECNSYSRSKLAKSQICMGSSSGADACFGDSGGPLILGKNLDNHYTSFVAGIVSFGYGRECGVKPSVYTYVPYYMDWIHTIINTSTIY